MEDFQNTYGGTVQIQDIRSDARKVEKNMFILSN